MKKELIETSKPPHLPAVYGYADKFFGKVEPMLETVLNKYRRRLTLAQTVGSSYHQFQPFLLDYPAIRKLLANTKSKDETFWLHFWHEVDNFSVHRQFSESYPKLKEIFVSSKEALKPFQDFKSHCSQQEIAQATFIAWLPTHLDEKIFQQAFPFSDQFGRANRIDEMQKFCGQVVFRPGLESLVLDLFNATVYRNSFAFHVYKRVNSILESCWEHAMQQITIVIPDDKYIYRQWKEIMQWYAVNEKLAEVSKAMFDEDLEAGKFFTTVFCLRDLELRKNAIAIKQKLISTFLKDRNEAKALLRSTIESYPFAASYWVRHEIKNWLVK